MKTIFLSHANEEAQLAATLRSWIEDAFLGEVQVFVSAEKDVIVPGQEWFRRLKSGLSEAKLVLVLASPASVHKSWVNFEIGAAWVRDIPVLPLCHSGMSVDILPVPLQFFQGLDIESDSFCKELQEALASNLGFSRAPRIDYGEMRDDVAKSLRSNSQVGSRDEEQLGFLDHVVEMNDAFSRLGNGLELFSTHTRSMTDKTREFVAKRDRILERKEEAGSIFLRRLAKQLASDVNEYASRIKSFVVDYRADLTQAEVSVEFVIRFQKPSSSEEKVAIEEMLSTTDTAREEIDSFRAVIRSNIDTIDALPNLQKDLTKAMKSVATEYSELQQLLTRTIEMFDKVEAIAKSLVQ